MYINYEEIERRLEVACKIADAKALVAEQLGFLLAVATAVCAHLKYDSFILSAITLVVVYFISTRKYKKESEAAWQAYNNRPSDPDDD